MSARKLATLTGDEPKNVQRWLAEKTKTAVETIPADFIGRCEAKGFAPARYLLTGEGPDRVLPLDDAGVRLDVIGRIADGKLDARALSALRRGSPEAIADALADLLDPPNEGQGP